MIPPAPFSMDRSLAFSMALRAAGLTLAGWTRAYLDEPASESFVSRVARGKAQSARVSDAIDRFLAEQAPAVGRLFAPYRMAA